MDFKFFEQAEPYYRKKIEPWRTKADILLSGEVSFDAGIDAIVVRCMQQSFHLRTMNDFVFENLSSLVKGLSEEQSAESASL